MNEIEISIRSIQHYLYCPHRWGLLEIDRAWVENVFVTKANLMHSRVHEPGYHYSSESRVTFSSVPVYNDLEDYNLYGMVDCLEVRKCKDGVVVPGVSWPCSVCIIEYKPTKPKNRNYHEEDLMQVFAQKLCVDYVFGCNSEAVLYYADVKKRVKLPLEENFKIYDGRLKAVLKEMRKNLKNGIIPPIVKGQNCNGCSMKDMCMPSVKKGKSLQMRIKEIGETEL